MNTENNIKFEDNIILKFKTEIKELYQSKFIDGLNQKRILPHTELIQSVMYEIGINNFKEKDIFFLKEWHENITTMAFAKSYFIDDKAREIIIHDHKSLQTEQDGILTDLLQINIGEKDFQLALEVFAVNANIEWNYSNPFVSFFAKVFNNKFRVTLTHFSISPTNKSKVFFRRINNTPFNIELFSNNLEVTSLIKKYISDKKNIIISGKTGSGKSSLLSSIIDLIPRNEHIIVMEDTHEIFPTRKNITPMLAKQLKNKTLIDYCSYSLRMRPDRIILGEMRSTEIVPFILAMNNGHKGLMSTIHANSAIDTIPRLSLLFSLYSKGTSINYELITKLICQNISVVIYMHNKKIVEIIEILGAENGVPFIEEIYKKN